MFAHLEPHWELLLPRVSLIGAPPTAQTVAPRVTMTSLLSSQGQWYVGPQPSSPPGTMYCSGFGSLPPHPCSISFPAPAQPRGKCVMLPTLSHQATPLNTCPWLASPQSIQPKLQPEPH